MGHGACVAARPRVVGRVGRPRYGQAMRLLHTSDWHLGRTLHGVNLHAAQQAVVDHLVEVVAAEEVDVVLISGDVYDRAIPPVESVALLGSALARLSQLAQVIVTSGNHDSATRLGFGSAVFRDEVHIRTSLADVGRPVRVVGRDGVAAWVYPLPYLEPDAARVAFAHTANDDGVVVPLGRSHEAVMAGALRLVHEDVAQRRAVHGHADATDSGGAGGATVVMAHAFVVGGEASESERDIKIGGVDSVPAGLFAGIDYVALGHLHGPQQITVPGEYRTVARYSGSPLAYSFSERNHHKSSVLVEVGPDGVVGEPRLIPAPVPRPLSQIEDELEAVLSDKYVRQRDDWVRIFLTDSAAPARYLERIRAVFPHALVVLRRPRGQVDGLARVAAITPASDPVHVAAEFMEYVTEQPTSPAERAVLAGVFEELARAERDA